MLHFIILYFSSSSSRICANQETRFFDSPFLLVPIWNQLFFPPSLFSAQNYPQNCTGWSLVKLGLTRRGAIGDLHFFCTAYNSTISTLISHSLYVKFNCCNLAFAHQDFDQKVGWFFGQWQLRRAITKNPWKIKKLYIINFQCLWCFLDAMASLDCIGGIRRNDR